MGKQLKPDTFLLHINGGLGKCIIATAVIKSYKQANPDQKIVVVSGYPEVFLNSPYVWRTFAFSSPYLWKDYYSKPNVKVYAGEPYYTQDWIKGNDRHLISIWCEELGVPSIQETPELYFSGPEIDEISAMIKTDKPLMVVQSTGGPTPSARSWTRNPPQEELEKFLEAFQNQNYILHLALPETPKLNSVHQRLDNVSRRIAMGLIYLANAFVGIDSFGMHARAAAVGKFENLNTVIFFPLASSVKRLGYPQFMNLVPTPEICQMIENSQDYFASLFQHSIDSLSENCPVPEGKTWFEFEISKA